MKFTEQVDKLLAELRIAIPQTYSALKQESPDLCGFSVCTTAYLEPIVPIYQRTADLPKTTDKSYHFKKYHPAEWNRGGKQEFSKAAATARAELEKISNAASSGDRSQIQKAYLNGILAVLVELEQAGSFGPRSDERYLTMWLLGDDEEWILKASKTLNTPALHKAVVKALQ